MARPDDFATRLAKVNTARDGRVVPVIKLAKAMADCFITRPNDLTPLLVSEASRVQLPLQHTPLATCFSTSCVDGRGSSLIPTVWNKEFTESAQDYMSRTNLSVKVLDFVQLGGFY